jgi:PKD repeat protein
LSATLALISLGCLAPLAGADENTSEPVTALVYRAGSAVALSDSATVAELEASCPTYAGPNIELYQADGSQTPGQLVSAKAWSLGTLLGCLPVPVPLSTVTAITVIGAAGPELNEPPELSQLSPSDLASPSDFANPLESPVLYSDGSGVIYDRPWRGGADANADDQVVEAAPTPFVFEVFEGAPLHVEVSAAPTSLPAGGTVSFNASVSGEPAGSPLNYSWDFDGGAAASAATAPAVSFASAGYYLVTLQVTDTAGGGGAATIPVTVSSGTATTPTATHSDTPTGPQQSGGTRPRAKPGKHTAATPGSASTGRNTSGSTAAGGGRRTTSSHGATAPPAATSASTSTNTATASAGGSTAVSSTTTRAAGSRDPHAARHHSALHGGAPARGSLVSGRLISDVTLLSVAASPLVHGSQAAAASAPALRRALGAPLAPALGATLAVLLLFGLGAGHELRGRRSP